jgi:hypothetical protein
VNGRRALLVLLTTAALLVPATLSAQSTGSIAVGVQWGTRSPVSADERSSREIGFTWRLGHGDTGWGWDAAFNWFGTDLTRWIDGLPVELGELHVHPFMAGYGYHYRMGRFSLGAKAFGGYALSSFKLSAAGDDAYRSRLGARSVTVDATNVVVVKPELSLWYDVSRKVGFNINVGYLVARPQVTIRSTLGVDTRRVRADMMMLKLGVVYALF